MPPPVMPTPLETQITVALRVASQNVFCGVGFGRRAASPACPKPPCRKTFWQRNGARRGLFQQPVKERPRIGGPRGRDGFSSEKSGFETRRIRILRVEKRGFSPKRRPLPDGSPILGRSLGRKALHPGMRLRTHPDGGWPPPSRSLRALPCRKKTFRGALRTRRRALLWKGASFKKGVLSRITGTLPRP
jgi:hypothetical protein